MNARVKRGDAQGRVLKMRRGDDDGVHVAGFDERLAVRGSLQRLVSVERREGITHGHEFAAADLFVGKIIGMVLPNVAHADDAEMHFVHVQGV